MTSTEYTIAVISIYHTQIHNMSTITSNKRQRLEYPVEYTPYDAPDSPRHKDLSHQSSWTPYEVNPTEAQITEVVDKLDVADVKNLLVQSIKDLDESDARKLLINTAVSTPPIAMEIWNALMHNQLLNMDEKMRKIQERIQGPVRSVLPVQQVQ
jgi:hypothetical protein